jgi:hypothetical protein
VLGNYKNILTDFGIGNAYIFATASLRNIANTEEAVKRIEDEMGLYVDVLSGEEEARLGFMGATLAVNIEKGLFIDIGGGSTELVTFRKREIQKHQHAGGLYEPFSQAYRRPAAHRRRHKKSSRTFFRRWGKRTLSKRETERNCGIAALSGPRASSITSFTSLPCTMRPWKRKT